MIEGSPNHLHRALVLTIPAAALLSVPIGFQLQLILAPPRGLTWLAPPALIPSGILLLAAGTLVCSTLALGVCCNQLCRQRPLAAGLLVLINFLAQIGGIAAACLVYFFGFSRF